jgi:hypothetical protein
MTFKGPFDVIQDITLPRLVKSRACYVKPDMTAAIDHLQFRAIQGRILRQVKVFAHHVRKGSTAHLVLPAAFLALVWSLQSEMA